VRRDRGAATIELAIWAPGILFLIGLLMIISRFMLTQQQVDSVAYDVARSASLQRSAWEAETAAQDTANFFFTQHSGSADLTCVNSYAVVNTTGFAAAVGTPASVSAQVHCDVRFTDLIVPGWNVTIFDITVPIDAHFVSPLDTYRVRS
jgi:Flp pilus assembly protein TadG